MKNQNSFSSPHSSSKRVKLFNPNSSKVDQDLSRIKTILTKQLMPTSFNQQVSEAFSQLYSKIPRYESSANLPEASRVGDFDPFWKQWLIFRDQISKLTDQSIIFFYQEFMNERFDEFNEILEDLNTKPPQKVPLYREYDKSKKDIQTSFENLQQILLEQFDVDLEEDEEDDKKTNKRIETIIKNLQSQRSKIRQIKSDVESKHRPFFTNSSQEKELSEKQHQRCVKIIDEILIKINGLPKQYHQFNSVNNELAKAEAKIKANFPPNKVDVLNFDGKKDENLIINQIDHDGQINKDEEEELFEEEEEEVILEEDLEYEEEEENQVEQQNQRHSKIKQTNSIDLDSKSFVQNVNQSPVKYQNSSTKKAPLTPPPTAKNLFRQNQTNLLNQGQFDESQQQQQERRQQKMPLTPQKKPPRLQLDDSDTYPKRSQNVSNRQPPQSAKQVQKLPHIKPLDLEDDALVDTFHGLSFSFSSSSSSSDNEEGGGSGSSRGKKNGGKNDRDNRNNRSNINHRNVTSNPTKSSQSGQNQQSTTSARLSYKVFQKREGFQPQNVDPSVHKGGTRSGGAWRNGNKETSHSFVGESGLNGADYEDDDDVWSFQSNKTTPPSSPRGAPQATRGLQSSAPRMRSKSPSSSILRRRIINNHNSDSDDVITVKDQSRGQIERPNSSLTNAPPSPAKKHATVGNETERFNSVGGIIDTDSSELNINIASGKNGEFNTQPSIPISPVRSIQSPRQPQNTKTIPENVPKPSQTVPEQQPNTANQRQSEGLRQQLLAVTKEKENLQIQLANMKGEIEQLKDDYQTIVVQLQIAYEENKESIEETSKLNSTIERMSKEKETMSAKIKDLQLLLLQTPVFDSSDKVGKRDLPEKLKKLGSSDSNSEDEEEVTKNSTSKSSSSTSTSSSQKGKKKRKSKKDSEKDDSDDNDLNKTVLMYQTKLKNLMYEKEALYDNINKLADDNAQLKEQLNNISASPSPPPLDQPYYIDQLKLLEEDQEYFAEELQRVWKSYDSLLSRLSSKSKDDSVYFENSKLHKENDKLHSKLIATRKEIQFLKDIRKSSVNSKNSKNGKNSNLNENDIEKVELRKKLEDEKRKNEALIKALREEKSKTAAQIVSEDEHRQLFNAKLTIHKLQYELQKVSSKFVHVKGKNKRLKLMMNEKGIQIVKDEMTNEIDAMRDAYESAIDWGYAQQEISIKEQSEKEALAFKVKMLEENLKKVSKDDQIPFNSQTEDLLAEMKTKIEEKLKLQHELDVIRELAVEQLHNENDNDNQDDDDANSNLSTADLVEKALQTNRNERK